MFAFEKSVGAVVFRRENNAIEYLLLNHGNDYWNFPKGHTEAKETNEETLRREIAEETGIDNLKINPSFRKFSHYFYRAVGAEKQERIAAGRKINVFKTVIFYLAETSKQEVALSLEHTDFVWLEFESALGKLIYKNSQKILKQAQKELEKYFAKKESLG